MSAATNHLVNAASGVVIVDTDQRVLAADRIFLEAIAGRREEDVVGRTIADVLRIGTGVNDVLPIVNAQNGSFRLLAGPGRGRQLRVSYAHVRMEADPNGAVFLTIEDLTPA